MKDFVFSFPIALHIMRESFDAMVAKNQLDPATLPDLAAVGGKQIGQ
ncbi:MAG: hypothetical protein ABRQ23_00745 [Syntrophomonadaceae bacterium]